ncbi:aldo/keto reductase [Streptomyces radicis]|uniref:Aldo/keto reductase n=1 Tax=Streptomyces radicis TaxID=1750517 RepID=A0A3A9W9Q5_9ACTN|nr:aldo/keto reductase [Streptomyces radicis]RKN09620.1 aldo/keto reductase [Streptomyces radicis]
MSVADLGLGTYRVRPEALSEAVRLASLDVETAWVDTAPNYLDGGAQTRLRPLLSEYGLPVSTKVGFLSRAAAAAAVTAGVLSEKIAERGHCLTDAYVHWQCARNRVELGRDRVDVVFTHNPERAPGDAYASLREAFTALEAEAEAGALGTYGVATWHGFDSGALSVPELDRLADEVRRGGGHRLRAIQLPVSLVSATAFMQALDGEGPIAEAAARGWEVYASAPLFGGELPELATRELADLLDPRLSVAQACLLAVASCPGVTRVLLSASNPAHWEEARAVFSMPPLPVSTLRKVLDVLASD